MNDNNINTRASVGRDALRLAVIALAYFFAHQLSYMFPDSERVLMAIWPAGGIGLAALLFNPRRLWPAIAVTLFLAGNTANLLAGERSVVASIGFMTANVLESLACAWLIARSCGEDVRFDRIKQITALIAAATLVNAGIAFIGAGTGALTPGASFWNFWITWWITHGLGILLITPLIITWAKLQDMRWGQAAEWGAFMIIWCGSAWLVFSGGTMFQLPIVRPYTLIALLAWPALRLGQRGTSIALIVLAAIAIISTTASGNTSPWDAQDPEARLLLSQIYLGFAAVTGMLLAASYAEAQSAEQASREEQARLRASEEKFRTITEQMSDVVYLTDTQGILIYVSPAAEQTFGFRPDEMQEHPFTEFLAETDVPKAMTAFMRDVTTGASSKNFALQMKRKDGSVFAGELNGTPYRKDGIAGTIGLIRDITERVRTEAVRQQAEEALRESEASLKFSQQVAHVGHWTWDTVTNRVAWSDEMHRIFGLDPATFDGDLDQVITQAIHPDDREKVISSNTVVLTEQKPAPLEYRVIWPDQSVHTVWAEAGARVVDANGRILKLSGIVQDITERKRYEAELERRAEELSTLQEMVLDITMPHSLAELLHLIVERAARFLHADSGGMYLTEPDQRRVRCVVSYNTARDFRGILLNYGEGAAGRVAQTGEPLMIEDYGQWSGRATTFEPDRPFEAVISAPMLWQGQVTGVIHVLREKKFTQEELGLLSLFANHAAVAVENARLYESSERELAERKLAEEALGESEERMRRLASAAFEGIVFTESGKIIEGNEQLAHIFGYELSEMIGRPVMDLVAPESRPSALEKIRSGFEGTYEYLALRKDGSIFPVEVQARMLTVQGRAVRVTALRDITERKRAEEESSRLASVIRHSLELVNLATPDGTMFFLNDAGKKMLGISEENVAQTNIMRVIPDHLVDKVRQEVLPSIIGDGYWEGDLQYLNLETGGLTDVHAITFKIADLETGALQFLANVSLDITERKQAEEALRESEWRNRMVTEMTTDYIFIVDVDRAGALKLRWASDSMVRLTGRTVAEAATPELWKSIVHPDDAPAFFGFIQRLIASGEAGAIECRTFVRSGVERWIQLDAQPQRDESGAVTSIIGAIKDVSERKRAEETLQRRNAELTVLNQIGQALNKLAEPREILELVFAEIGHVLDNRNLYIALYDQASQHISFPIYTIDGERRTVGGRPLGNGITDYVIRSNAPFLVKRDMAEALNQRGIELIGRPSRCFLAVPMRAGDQVVGVVALQDYDRENVYDEHHVELLATVAAQAAIALENARLFSAVRQELQERKRAEQALQESEERFRSLYENASIGIYRTTPNGRILMANPAAVHLLGYNSFTELASRNLETDGFDPSYPRQEFREQLESDGVITGLESAWTKRDGTTIFVRESARAIRNESGAVVYYDGTFEDITERKRVEEALRESEERFRVLIEQSHDAIALLAADGTVLYDSPSIARVLGYGPTERVGRSVFEFVHPEERQRMADGFAKFVHQTGAVAPSDVRFLHKDGTPRQIEGVRTNLLHEPAVRAVVVNYRDVTERKQAEEQIKKALAEKETLLRELYHRTKNNMQVIISLLRLQAVEVPDTRLQAILRDTQNRIRSMALVHQKLYEAGDLSHVNLREYIGDLVRLLMSSYRLSPGQVTLVSELDDLLVLIDTAMPCGLVLNELISNAFKHAFPAGRSGEVRLHLSRTESGEIQLSVADDGVGVPSGFDFRRDGHLGLQNVFVIVEHQLRGQVAFHADRGVMCQIEFRDDQYTPRV